MRYNTFGIGLLLGALVPVLGYILIGGIFDLLSQTGVLDSAPSGLHSRRERTVILFAICCNLIPLNIFRRRRMDNSMRGIVIPTMVYVGAWLYIFSDILFNS